MFPWLRRWINEYFFVIVLLNHILSSPGVPKTQWTTKFVFLLHIWSDGVDFSFFRFIMISGEIKGSYGDLLSIENSPSIYSFDIETFETNDNMILFFLSSLLWPDSLNIQNVVSCRRSIFLLLVTNVYRMNMIEKVLMKINHKIASKHWLSIWFVWMMHRKSCWVSSTFTAWKSSDNNYQHSFNISSSWIWSSIESSTNQSFSSIDRWISSISASDLATIIFIIQIYWWQRNESHSFDICISNRDEQVCTDFIFYLSKYFLLIQTELILSLIEFLNRLDSKYWSDI